eukprot:9103556-Karenia_brevis.AAC.1
MASDVYDAGTGIILMMPSQFRWAKRSSKLINLYTGLFVPQVCRTLMVQGLAFGTRANPETAPAALINQMLVPYLSSTYLINLCLALWSCPTQPHQLRVCACVAIQIDGGGLGRVWWVEVVVPTGRCPG